MNENDEKMVGARLSDEMREKLAAIQLHYRRTFRAQLEAWIELEHQIIARG